MEEIRLRRGDGGGGAQEEENEEEKRKRGKVGKWERGKEGKRRM